VGELLGAELVRIEDDHARPLQPGQVDVFWFRRHRQRGQPAAARFVELVF